MVKSTCPEPTQYYESAIESFRPCFSRQASFCWFAVVMVGFTVRQDAWGLSSIVRWLALSPSCYECLLNFFHSSAWDLEGLLLHWWVWLGGRAPFVEVQGRRVLLGDHTKLAKEGRKMPGVTTLHQDSETQSKPGFFRGHNWAFVAGLLSRAGAVFAIPLCGKLDQGIEESGQPTDHESSMTTRIVHLAITVAIRMGSPCYLVLDAFFAVGPTFLAAASVWCVARREPLVHIITRAKKNAVAYLDPQKPPPGRRGRKPKYGPKLRLYDLFSERADDFTSAPCEVYDRVETISYLCLNLLWKPLGHKLRFVLAVTSRGPVVLMCSDLQFDPLQVLRLYCLRTRIETIVGDRAKPATRSRVKTGHFEQGLVRWIASPDLHGGAHGEPYQSGYGQFDSDATPTRLVQSTDCQRTERSSGHGGAVYPPSRV